MKKKSERSFFDIKHEYDDSLKEYMLAVTMLHQSVKTVLTIYRKGITEEQTDRLIESLREYEENLDRILHKVSSERK